MKKIIYILLLGSISAMSFQGCKKDIRTDEISTKVARNTPDLNLTKFLVITLVTTEDKVIYVEKDKEFIINGWFHKSLESVKAEYDMANEYKARYEK
ncbi:hypothetical protein OQX63_20245 [Pedobacter sp. PF22-3]|uniref:hypothetical protein n=1 Tax=Pedobacter sp. PF22-3 TaxID=2994467 RepID=UPI00224775C4|nr:hypothetical protein [Pedobacter sp. PF22-3]MCX2495836.1 hypothetical protein [Pedobacter sp. PF22-3]